MSYEPNLKAAREIFARRVADAYQVVWHGFGFVGEEYSAEKAKELGDNAAKHCFPLPMAPIVVNIEADAEKMRELLRLVNTPGPMVRAYEPMEMTYGDDGVVGD